MPAVTTAIARAPNEIATPTRATSFDAAIGICAAAALIVLPLAGSLATGADLAALRLYWGAAEGWGIVVSVSTLLLLSWLTERQAVRGLALVVFVFAGSVALAPYVVPVLTPTPFNTLYLVAPLAFVGLTRLLPGYDRSFGWLRRGRFTRGVIIAVVILAAAFVGSLFVYVKLLHPDLTHQPVMSSHRFGGIALFAIGVGIAMLNAAVEEAASRGILMQALDAVFGSGIAPILIQAVAFGALHFNSTEPGIAGVVLTMLAGVVFGALRRASRGILAPYIVHVAADIAVWTLGMSQL